MKLVPPLTSKQIRVILQKLINEIHQETDWPILRQLSKTQITLGEAPAFGSSFGVTRTQTKITFGSWLNDLSPEVYQNTLWEFLLIREALAFFFEDWLLFNNSIILPHYILNLVALCKLRTKYHQREFASRAYNIRFRFIQFSTDKERHPERTAFLNTIHSLSKSIILQQLPYKLILETFQFFFDSPNDFASFENEILDNFNNYLSFKVEDIIAPVRMRKITLQVIKALLQQGFNVSLTSLESQLQVDYTLISRELVKLTNRFNAKFWVEKNFHKLGLHYYTVFIRLKDKSHGAIEEIQKDLLQIPYIEAIYEGRGANSVHLFNTVMLTPHLMADSLERRLEKRRKTGLVDSFEVKPLKNRIFMTTLIDKHFKPTLSNFKALLNEKIDCVKLETWNNNFFTEDVPYKFSINEKNLLRFLSIYKSHSLTNPQLYSGFGPQLQEFLSENNINFSQIDEFLSFMNKLRNDAIEKGLINFRLVLTPSSVSQKEMLILKIMDDSKENLEMLLKQLAIFNWVNYHITFDGLIVRILGLDSNHKIAKILYDFINEKGLSVEVFSIKQKIFRYVPLDELYSYEGHLWKLK